MRSRPLMALRASLAPMQEVFSTAYTTSLSAAAVAVGSGMATLCRSAERSMFQVLTSMRSRSSPTGEFATSRIAVSCVFRQSIGGQMSGNARLTGASRSALTYSCFALDRTTSFRRRSRKSAPILTRRSRFPDSTPSTTTARFFGRWSSVENCARR